MRKNGFFHGLSLSLLVEMLFFAGCSPSTPPSMGYLAEVNGTLVTVPEGPESERFCKEHYCEPNYIIDAYFGRRRSPPTGSPFTPVPAPTPSPVFSESDFLDQSKLRMNIETAWKLTEGIPEIIVAVIDSGINLEHPDLKSNLWINPYETASEPGVDHDGNGYPNDVHGFDFYGMKGEPLDQNGHGTHTAGTIAAARNQMGVLGVAPHVKLMPLRFLGPEGQGSTYAAIQAIDYAVRMGARVISASWGGAGFSSLLAQSVQRAQEAGVLFVAAAGNEGRNLNVTPVYPASLPGVIAVGATELNDQLATFSNYGSNTVMIAAPGVSILSTYLNQGYRELSGTSMATPHVSGAIALALSRNKSLTAEFIKTILCNSADPIPVYGVRCGRMNIGRFIESI